jgi:hypothetical protein
MGPRVNYRSLGASPRCFLQAPNSFSRGFYRLLEANSQQLPGNSKSPGLVRYTISNDLFQGCFELRMSIYVGNIIEYVL